MFTPLYLCKHRKLIERVQYPVDPHIILLQPLQITCQPPVHSQHKCIHPQGGDIYIYIYTSPNNYIPNYRTISTTHPPNSTMPPTLFFLPFLPLLFLLPLSLAQPFLSLSLTPNRAPFPYIPLTPPSATCVKSSLPSIPPPHNTQCRNAPTLSISHPLAPGRYHVHLYFIEYNCRARRRFDILVNTKRAAAVDVLAEVGCNVVLERVLRTVRVRGMLNIELIALSGPAPGLSAVRVFRAPLIPTPSPSSEDDDEIAPSQFPIITPTPSSIPSNIPNPSSSSTPFPIPPLPSSMAPAPDGTRVTVVQLNAGGGTDRPEWVVGPSSVFRTVVPITGTSDARTYSQHRFGAAFEYRVPLPGGARYDVLLQFSEAFIGGCAPNFRAFDVEVYDQEQGRGRGVSFNNVKVFERSGCRAAYNLSVTDVEVGDVGEVAMLVIDLRARVENAMISGFVITTTDSRYSVLPTPSPTPLPQIQSVYLNLGINDTAPFATARVTTPTAITRTSGLRGSVFKTGRQGTNFFYRFRLAPGAYDIVLGFAETSEPFCSAPGNRVFNVFVNDQVQLEGFDIYARAAGCYKGVEIALPRQSVGSVDIKPLTIRFVAITDVATVSYLSIRPARQVCVPDSFTGAFADGADHAAHSVPGTYPPQINANSPKSYVDRDGDGFVTVNVDGGQSHTHYFDAANNIRGRLRHFTWTIVETGEIISTRQKFTYTFPLGTTRLRLAVLDNSCTTDESETTVTVTAAIQPGIYCYYYAGLTEPLVGGTLTDLSPRPQFAAVSRSGRIAPPRFAFRNTLFSARCIFFLQVDQDDPTAKIQLLTSSSGDAHLFKGQDLIVDTVSSAIATTALSVGLTAFEVLYQRTTLGKQPRITLKVNNKIPASNKFWHDQRTVVPILNALSPEEGPNAGSTRVKISGYGLFQPLTVQFGRKQVNVLSSGSTQTNFFVNSPSFTSNAVVDIFVSSSAGIVSNPMAFQYGSACNSISFLETQLKTQTDEAIDFIGLPTCVTIGQDGKLYIGTLGATIQVLGYNPETLVTTSHCYSKTISDPNYFLRGKPSKRDILGIAFNPKDKQMLVYATTSTLFGHSKGKNRVDLTDKSAWRNGAVERIKPGTDPTDDSVCMVYDKRIITGLPVSNHDHSVNGLLFNNDGDLFIAVGGNTNMGLPGFRLGNYWETRLSSAILLAKLSDPAFNGTISYTNPLTARHAIPQNTFITTYATGFRNPFSIAMTRSGELYCTDQGPNCNFGNVATGCEDYKESSARKYDVLANIDWPARVTTGPPACPQSIWRPDKILHITAGRWYGHANLQRGLDGLTRECAWIDPFTGMTADDKDAPTGYKPPMRTVRSSVTAISEYRANHFCGKLQGDLILSTFKGKTTYRMGVNGNRVTSGPDELSKVGGIAFAEDAHGNMIFPLLSSNIVRVLKPKSMEAGVFVAGVVPWRHGRKGGTIMMVGGLNFGTAASVKVGGKVCQVMRVSEREIVCKVPKGRGLKDVVVRRSDGEEDVLTGAVLYMNV